MRKIRWCDISHSRMARGEANFITLALGWASVFLLLPLGPDALPRRQGLPYSAVSARVFSTHAPIPCTIGRWDGVDMTTNHRGSLVPSTSRDVSAAPGMDLLNPNLLFGTAWFWTLPEVHRVEREIEALTNLFRRSIGMDGETH
jgi:hypothetical protein